MDFWRNPGAQFKLPFNLSHSETDQSRQLSEKELLSNLHKKVTFPPHASVFSFIKKEKNSYFLIQSMGRRNRNNKQILIFNIKKAIEMLNYNCNPFDSVQRIWIKVSG